LYLLQLNRLTILLKFVNYFVPYHRFECESIYDIICSKNKYKTLCGILNDQGQLSDSLKNDVFTLFAPNDKAFETAATEGVDLSNAETVAGLLQYHTIENTILRSEDLGCDEAYTMTGSTLTTTHECDEFAVYQVGGGNAADAKPKIIDADRAACNGIIHGVNKLILPP